MQAEGGERLTARQIHRLMAPSRRWWLWAGGIGLAWLMAGLVWHRVRENGGDLWLAADVPMDPMVLGVWVLPVILLVLPAVLAPLLLDGDLRAGRLQPLLLTTAGRLPFLIAYRRRVLVVAALLLLAFVPFWAPAGRGPAALYLMPDMLDVLAGHNGEGSFWWAAQISLSGLLSDLAAIWLAASLGLAAATVVRGRVLALLTSLAASFAFALLSWGAGAMWAGLLDSWGMRWMESNTPYVYIENREPGFTTLCWGFALVYVVAAVILSEMSVRLAASRLDRLASD